MGTLDKVKHAIRGLPERLGINGLPERFGIGRVQHKNKVYYADQDGDNGKPTEFKPDEHRKYDAKVRVPTSKRNAGGCLARCL
jgi:hypothetical protein